MLDERRGKNLNINETKRVEINERRNRRNVEYKEEKEKQRRKVKNLIENWLLFFSF